MFLFPSLIIIFYNYQCQFFLFEIQFSNFRPTDNNYIMRITYCTNYICQLTSGIVRQFWRSQNIFVFLKCSIGHAQNIFPRAGCPCISDNLLRTAGLGLDMTWQKIRCDQQSVRAPPPSRCGVPASAVLHCHIDTKRNGFLSGTIVVSRLFVSEVTRE